MRGDYSPSYEGKEILAVIGRRAKRWRIYESSYTQKNIADMIGITSNLICRFEYGKANNAVILYKYIELGFNPNKEY